MTTIHYKRNSRFEQQIKKLLRKYITLEDDLNIAQTRTIHLFHVMKLDNHSVELIPCFDHDNIKIYKMKKFACKSLKGKGVQSGIRIIYAFYPVTYNVEYLEIYYKEKTDSDMNYAFIKKYFEQSH